MPPTVAEVEAQALQLSANERARLVDRLLASLPPDAELDAAWAAEACRRLDELDTGSVAEIPIEDAIARARAAMR